MTYSLILLAFHIIFSCHIGLDDNWQKVETFGNGQCTYHDEVGNPLINTERFPNLNEMTNHGHQLGLTVGWYFNNCYGCHEKCPAHRQDMSHPSYPFTSRNDSIISTGKSTKPEGWNPQIHLGERQGISHKRCYRGDVKALFDYGFDGVKLDACGWQMNLDLWQGLMAEEYQRRTQQSSLSSLKPMLIEACHWGETKPDIPDYKIDEKNQIVDTAWCPFHFWRTSGDIWYV